MPKKFDPEVKDRAVRMVLDRVEEAGSVTKAVALVSPKVDVGRETLRRWVSQHRDDAGSPPMSQEANPHAAAPVTRAVRGDVMGTSLHEVNAGAPAPKPSTRH